MADPPRRAATAADAVAPDIRDTLAPDPTERTDPAQRRRVPPPDEVTATVDRAHLVLAEVADRRAAEQAAAEHAAELEPDETSAPPTPPPSRRWTTPCAGVTVGAPAELSVGGATIARTAAGHAQGPAMTQPDVYLLAAIRALHRPAPPRPDQRDDRARRHPAAPEVPQPDGGMIYRCLTEFPDRRHRDRAGLHAHATNSTAAGSGPRSPTG